MRLTHTTTTSHDICKTDRKSTSILVVYAGCVDIRPDGSLDLVSDAREEVPHAAQVGLALQLLVDAVIGADGRLVLQITEIRPVTAFTTGRAHTAHHFQGAVDGTMPCAGT